MIEVRPADGSNFKVERSVPDPNLANGPGRLLSGFPFAQMTGLIDALHRVGRIWHMTVPSRMTLSSCGRGSRLFVWPVAVLVASLLAQIMVTICACCEVVHIDKSFLWNSMDCHAPVFGTCSPPSGRWSLTVSQKHLARPRRRAAQRNEDPSMYTSVFHKRCWMSVVRRQPCIGMRESRCASTPNRVPGTVQPVFLWNCLYESQVLPAVRVS